MSVVRICRTLPLLALAVGAIPVAAQTIIELDQVRDNIRRFVQVEAKVARVFRAGSDTWVSLGKSYPGSPLVIVVPSTVAATIPNLQGFGGKMVRVTGRIEPSEQEAPPNRTRQPGEAATARKPSKPYILLQDPGMLVVIEQGGSQ